MVSPKNKYRYRFTMLYFEYAVEINEDGIRIQDPDHMEQFDPAYMFERHAWLPGTIFSYEEHPDGGLWLKRVAAEEFKDKGL